jgi:hypothetical protein
MQYESLQLGSQEECRAIKVIGTGDPPCQVLEVGEYVCLRPELLEYRENAGRDVIGDLVVSYFQNSSAVFEDLFPVFLLRRRRLPDPTFLSARCPNIRRRTRTNPRPGFLVFFNKCGGNRPMTGASESANVIIFSQQCKKQHSLTKLSP